MSGKTGKGADAPKVTIVIKKEEIIEGGHHGGAWKVAYADFVTAMMAFFLLLWLLSSTTTTQRVGLADYFTPSNLLSHSNSGSGQPFGGKTPNDEGDMVSDKGAVQINNDTKQVLQDVEDDQSDTPATPVVHQAQGNPEVNGNSVGGSRAAGQTPQDGLGRRQAGPDGQGRVRRDATTLEGTASGSGPLEQVGGAADQRGKPPTAAPAPPQSAEADQAARQAAREQAVLTRAAQQIRDAVRSDPALADLGKQLTVDLTSQGLRLQILDDDHQPMFAFGSATPNDRARQLLQRIAPALAPLTERITVVGHTDAAPYRGIDRSNWELSADRANATRRMLVDAGLHDDRFRSVTGDADRDPLLPADPLAAANRRIAILVQRDARAPAALPALAR